MNEEDYTSYNPFEIPFPTVPSCQRGAWRVRKVRLAAGEGREIRRRHSTLERDSVWVVNFSGAVEIFLIVAGLSTGLPSMSGEDNDDSRRMTMAVIRGHIIGLTAPCRRGLLWTFRSNRTQSMDGFRWVEVS